MEKDFRRWLEGKNKNHGFWVKAVAKQLKCTKIQTWLFRCNTKFHGFNIFYATCMVEKQSYSPVYLA